MIKKFKKMKMLTILGAATVPIALIVSCGSSTLNATKLNTLNTSFMKNKTWVLNSKKRIENLQEYKSIKNINDVFIENIPDSDETIAPAPLPSAPRQITKNILDSYDSNKKNALKNALKQTFIVKAMKKELAKAQYFLNNISKLDDSKMIQKNINFIMFLVFAMSIDNSNDKDLQKFLQNFHLDNLHSLTLEPNNLNSNTFFKEMSNLFSQIIDKNKKFVFLNENAINLNNQKDVASRILGEMFEAANSTSGGEDGNVASNYIKGIFSSFDTTFDISLNNVDYQVKAKDLGSEYFDAIKEGDNGIFKNQYEINLFFFSNFVRLAKMINLPAMIEAEDAKKSEVVPFQITFSKTKENKQLFQWKINENFKKEFSKHLPDIVQKYLKDTQVLAEISKSKNNQYSFNFQNNGEQFIGTLSQIINSDIDSNI